MQISDDGLVHQNLDRRNSRIHIAYNPWRAGSACKGGAYMCKAIGPKKCCNFDGFGVTRILWNDLGTTNLGLAYSGGKCAKKIHSGCGQKHKCLTAKGPTGASWKKGCSEPNLMDSGCESSVTPNAVSYLFAEADQMFVLETQDAVDTLRKIESFQEDLQKVKFLLSQGAEWRRTEDDDGNRTLAVE
ncbi:hypothetical protein R1sor_010609 [Riccia sorocarpa]|uniref:Uncharacterized protein n=1 Tax=Riccia sorocarpa TaxID=122646 RepID=A0ABD3HYT5_9MARC